MKSKSDLRISFTILFVTILVAFLAMTTVGNLKIGLGLGHQVHVLVETENVTELESFLSNQTRQQREWRQVTIDESHYLLMTSGVDNVKAYEEELKASVNNIDILKTGTFGTISKGVESKGYVNLYLILSMFLVSIYLCARFRFFGWIASMETVIAMTGSLFTMTQMGFPLTRSLWYTVLIVFLLLIYQKQRFLLDAEGLTYKESFEKDPDRMKRHMKVVLLQSFFVIVFGVVAVLFNTYGLIRTGWFMISIGYIVLIQFMFEYFVIHRLLKSIDGTSSFLRFQNHYVVFKKDNRDMIFRNVIIATISLIVVFIIFAIPRGMDIERGSDFTRQNVLVMNDASPTAFLEFQATLHEVGIFDHQKRYEVSEEGDTWLYFDENVDAVKLREASEGLYDKVGVAGMYFNTLPFSFPLQDSNFYIGLTIFIVTAGIVTALMFGMKAGVFVFFLTLFTIPIFIFLSIITGIEWTRETILVLWSIPILIGSYFTSQTSLLNFDDATHFKREYIDSAVLNILLLVIIAAPIFIVIPIPMALNMVQSLLIVLVAMYVTLAIIYGAKQLVRKHGNTHES